MTPRAPQRIKTRIRNEAFITPTVYTRAQGHAPSRFESAACAAEAASSAIQFGQQGENAFARVRYDMGSNQPAESLDFLFASFDGGAN